MKEENLSPSQIFNADETGLFLKCYLKNTWLKIGPTAKGHKVRKQRLTIRLCSNVSGKLKHPLVTGKWAKPRALRNSYLSALHAYTGHKNQHGCLVKILKQWFYSKCYSRSEKILKEVELPGRAVLFIDTVPCHPNADDLRDSDTFVRFLLAQTTALILTLDQGVKEAFKRHNRKNY